MTEQEKKREVEPKTQPLALGKQTSNILLESTVGTTIGTTVEAIASITLRATAVVLTIEVRSAGAVRICLVLANGAVELWASVELAMTL